jgi:hypothetical protein
MQVCPGFQVKVYDLKGPVDVPWDNFKMAKAALDEHESTSKSRFDWKTGQWGWDERVGWELWERSSQIYFRVCPRSVQISMSASP